MKRLDENGFFISKDFAKSKINLINKEFDFLIESKNFSPRTGFGDDNSKKNYAKYIGDPGSSFLTVNFYEVALEIINKIAENSEAQSINSGVIIVRAKTPAWRQELQLQKPQIIKKINKALTRKIIKDIRFV